MFSLTRNLAPNIARSAAGLPTIQVRNLILFEIMAKRERGNNQVGPWPATEEERIRAAKKYNLIPEDYEPHDYYEGMWDYPKFKTIGDKNKDPYLDYYDMVDRRFYGEVIHKDQDLYYWERVDPLLHEKMVNPSSRTRILIFLALAIAPPTLFWLTDRYRITPNHQHKIRDWDPKVQTYDFPSPS